MFSKDTKLELVQTVMELSELPVVEGSEVRKSETVTEWDVKDGVYTSTIDPQTGDIVYAPITKVSRHEKLKMFDIKLAISSAYDHMVTASEDHSLITLNPTTLELEKTRPEARNEVVWMRRHDHDSVLRRNSPAHEGGRHSQQQMLAHIISAENDFQSGFRDDPAQSILRGFATIHREVRTLGRRKTLRRADAQEIRARLAGDRHGGGILDLGGADGERRSRCKRQRRCAAECDLVQRRTVPSPVISRSSVRAGAPKVTRSPLNTATMFLTP